MNRRELLLTGSVLVTGGCLRFQEDQNQDANSPQTQSEGQGDAGTPATANAVQLEQAWKIHLDEVSIHNGGIFGVESNEGTQHLVKYDLNGQRQWFGDAIEEEFYERWTRTAGGGAYIGTAIHDDQTAEGAKLYAFETSDGSRRWDFRVANSRVESFAVGPDAVYCGTNDDGSGSEQEPVIYAIDREDGSERWSHADLPAAFLNAISVVGDRVFVGLGENIHVFDRRSGSRIDTINLRIGFGGWTRSNSIFYMGSIGDLRAYDTATDEEVWVTETLGNIKSRPLVVADLVIVGTEAGIAAFDRDTGDEVWQTNTRLEIDVKPAHWKGYVWAADGEGQLYGIRRTDGEIVFRSGYPERRNRHRLSTAEDYLLAGGTAYQMNQ